MKKGERRMTAQAALREVRRRICVLRNGHLKAAKERLGAGFSTLAKLHHEKASILNAAIHCVHEVSKTHRT